MEWGSALVVAPPLPPLPPPARPEVAAAGKRALGMRYKLLPYLYTAFHAAASTGAPVMRPLWLNFPQDRNAHRNDRRALRAGSERCWLNAGNLLCACWWAADSWERALLVSPKPATPQHPED